MYGTESCEIDRGGHVMHAQIAYRVPDMKYDRQPDNLSSLLSRNVLVIYELQ